MGLIWAVTTGSIPQMRQVPLRVYAFGATGLFAYHLLYFSALRLAPAAEAGLIAYLWPLLIVVFSGLLPSEKLRAGHLLGAAGAIEAIACIMAVKHDIVPPTINHFTDDPELDNKLNFTFNEAQKRVVDIALSNTFGFGGHNTSVIVKKFNG